MDLSNYFPKKITFKSLCSYDCNDEIRKLCKMYYPSKQFIMNIYNNYHRNILKSKTYFSCVYVCSYIFKDICQTDRQNVCLSVPPSVSLPYQISHDFVGELMRNVQIVQCPKSRTIKQLGTGDFSECCINWNYNEINKYFNNDGVS